MSNSELKNEVHIEITIFNILGQEIKTLEFYKKSVKITKSLKSIKHG